MMNNTVSKIERIRGDLKQIVNGLPAKNKIAKNYGPHDKQKLKKLTDWRNTTRVRLYRLQQENSQ
ncbi:hypothetical protein [Leuconostoc falkenbergense]|uniref:hypothetical protein n=1 Tax=Leuconostoc falkenbergense TaxID=2766470 RepID=UPI00293CFB51|nr:hypothetical protein [Leuconostoc falkenbergense]MDV3544900.1 hypothetical protein [Leuconostoc falkenbergense]